MELRESIVTVQERLAAAARGAGRDPGEITLCAATKVQTSDTIRDAIAAGITVCGENRVQELCAHLDDGAYDGAEVHFIGHLQTNKVKQVVGRVGLIHSVDSPHLLEAVHARAEQLGIVQDILLEVNVAGEANKGGVPPEEVLVLAERAALLSHVRLRGLMAIPPIPSEPGGNRPLFGVMRQLFIDTRRKIDDNSNDINCLSMGMSGDFEDAIREGATLVRVGTALFGLRPPMSGRP